MQAQSLEHLLDILRAAHVERLAIRKTELPYWMLARDYDLRYIYTGLGSSGDRELLGYPVKIVDADPGPALATIDLHGARVSLFEPNAATEAYEPVQQARAHGGVV